MTCPKCSSLMEERQLFTGHYWHCNLCEALSVPTKSSNSCPCAGGPTTCDACAPRFVSNTLNAAKNRNGYTFSIPALSPTRSAGCIHSIRNDKCLRCDASAEELFGKYTLWFTKAIALAIAPHAQQFVMADSNDQIRVYPRNVVESVLTIEKGGVYSTRGGLNAIRCLGWRPI